MLYSIVYVGNLSTYDYGFQFKYSEPLVVLKNYSKGIWVFGTILQVSVCD